MPLLKSKVIYLLFVNEWRMLWRSELGNSKYKKWRRYFLYLYFLIILFTISYHSIYDKNIPDSRGIMTCGFAITLFIWTSLKILKFYKDPVKAQFLFLSPLSQFIHISSQLVAHWLFHSTIMIVFMTPAILNMAFGGYPIIVYGYAIFYILALAVVSLTWILFSIVVRMYGVEGGRIFHKTIMFILSVIMLFGVFWYKSFIEALTFWWENSFVLLMWIGLFIACGSILFIVAVWIVCSTFKIIRRNIAGKTHGGAKQVERQGFFALLAKEYRLLFRLLKKMLMFVVFNYFVSFCLVWFLFRIIQPNEAYFYVSIMMVSFTIFIAGPGNILSINEEHCSTMLRASPTPIRSILIAKTIAVYSIFGPISLVITGLFLSVTNTDISRIFMGILGGFIIGMLSVWNGTVETMIRVLGYGFREMLIVSTPSLIGSLIVVILTYYINEMNLVILLILLVCAMLCYIISILTALRWLK